MNKQDELLRRIARSYVEEYGEGLNREREQLAGERFPGGTQRLERQVGRLARAQGRLPYLRAAATLAACLVLVVVALRIAEPGPGPNSPNEAGAPAVYEAIPLSFQLPEGFSQTGFEQDRGKSVYYLADALGDDVVMTLERASGGIDTAGLVPLTVNGSTCYGAQTESYGLLAFESGGVEYVLTCRHDINTLLQLGRAIL